MIYASSSSSRRAEKRAGALPVEVRCNKKFVAMPWNPPDTPAENFYQDHSMRQSRSTDATAAISKNGSGAFTLVELLVVISILALLLAILLPSLGKARQAAKAIHCSSKLHTIGLYFRFYNNDNNDWYPMTNDWVNFPASPKARFWYRLQVYTPNFNQTLQGERLKQFVCPATVESWQSVSVDNIFWSYTATHAYLYRPSLTDAWTGINWDYSSQSGPPASNRTSFYPRPSQTAMLGDGSQGGIGSPAASLTAWAETLWYPRVVKPDGGTPPTRTYPEMVYGVYREHGWQAWWSTPHQGAMNMLYFDGHVQPHSIDSLRGDMFTNYWGG